jgi:tetratricopeptide (TPR) repeat protein
VTPDDRPQTTKQELAETLRQAMTLHEQGRLDPADEWYAQVLDVEPDHLQALRLRGILARQRADYDSSIRLLQRLGRLAPDDPVPVNELALTYMASGELFAAERALRDAVRFDPSSRQGLANLGAILQRRGHLGEAAEHYAAYLDLEPDDLEVRCNLANALMEAGHGDRALVEIDEALARSPGHPLLLANKGAVLCGLDEFAAAIDVLEQAVDTDQGDDMALINLAYARRQSGDTAGAVDALQAAVRVNPANARAVADLANAEMQLGRNERALQHCADFLARYPGERLVLTAYIFALADDGQHDKSTALLGLDDLVTIVDCRVNCSAPGDYKDVAWFNRRLAEFVTAHPSFVFEPVRKSTTGGRQTGELNPAEDRVVEVFVEMVDDAIRNTVARWQRLGFGDHPVMAYAAERWALRIWGTVLGSGGHQAPHTHPLGWLSGVYYAQIPRDMQAEDSEAGALEFGMPPEHFHFTSHPELRRVEPAEGRLVLFPSYCFHRTLPFVAERERISIAFDVVPLSR